MASESSPTSRALMALEVLRSRPVTTADELGARLGVTERAARRYVAILREAGVPVESERGPHGGYRLGRGTRLPPVSFTQDEALVLVMAVLDGQSTSSDSTGLVGAALGKVVRALPDGVGREAAALREHASASPRAGDARPDAATTSALVAAVAERRVVVLAYRSDAGEAWESEVDPWAVVVRFGRWYLLCHSHRADAVRTFRIDRVAGVRPTERHFDPPEDLDPAAALEHHLGSGWQHRTRVVFEAPVDEVRPWLRGPMGRLEPHADGCVLVGSTRNPTMYAHEWLAGVPFAFRVEEGPELREAVAVLAARLAQSIGRSSSA
ncbi:helix-turn-helix transcriptional regulator [Nocardioides lijunqiniae]|uniref:helix-turn-helix transcriptional regulator n=1 Tax=Nocardioides lijunqiniae TaxID=2760832 RepID=UPI0018787589|nr:YafY family protein [Nocardioides lijunqiniae]